MKVHLIKKQTIEDYVIHNDQSRSAFRIWLTMIKFADWETAGDIRRTFGAADLLGNGTNRVVFDIGGNNYRLICKYAFGKAQVHLFICWIGTHAEYDRLCSRNLQYSIEQY